MLSLLHIENIAVIESADIQFDKGFNALTGETGAGKSIVVDAMIRTSKRTVLAKSLLLPVLYRMSWYRPNWLDRDICSTSSI